MKNITKKEANKLTMVILNAITYIGSQFEMAGEDDIGKRLLKDLSKAYKITTKYEKV